LRAGAKPKLAVWKFTSCDGCQLQILHLEDELLALADAVEIAHFTEATRAELSGPYEISIVEGSISTPEEVERIQRIREQSERLIAIGACATAGGIQALRNFASLDQMLTAVYASPEYVSTLERSSSIAAHVDVDFELQGCPPDSGQLLEVIGAMLEDRRPRISSRSVCMECKERGNVCVMVAHGTPCLGPITHAGCGAICPAYDRGCYGCFGPKETPNAPSLSAWWRRLGVSDPDLLSAYRHVNAGAPGFAEEAEAIEARERP
jgi:coenzyme F420-reducing hydrogenase gamma subunit